VAGTLSPSSADPDVTFTVGLPYDRGRLQRAVKRVSTPGSAEYRRFLSLSEAASRYGATPRQRAALITWAARRGMSVRFDATGLTARVTGPASAWERVYGKEISAGAGSPAPNLVSFYVPGATKDAFDSEVPASLRGVVRSIIPVYNVLEPSASARVTPSGQRGLALRPG